MSCLFGTAHAVHYCNYNPAINTVTSRKVRPQQCGSNLPTATLLIRAMATYAICTQTKCVISLLESKVVVLLLSVTHNLVKCCHPKLLLMRVSCRVLESIRRSSVIWTRVNAPSWSRCWTSSLPASRISQASATSCPTASGRPQSSFPSR